MADGGSSFAEATGFGTLRFRGSRGVGGVFSGTETQEWFKISVVGKKLKFGSFSYSTVAGLGEEDRGDVIPAVNLFFQSRGKGALKKIESFPGASNEATTYFPIRGAGVFYVQLVGVVNPLYNSYSINFSAKEKDFVN